MFIDIFRGILIHHGSLCDTEETVLIKKINITKYRKLENMEIDMMPGINIISGTNGTCKTSLLHMISNAYQAVTKNCDWLSDKNCLDIIKQINNITNPKIESLTKGDKTYNDPANGISGTLFSVDYFGHASLDFRKHNSKISSRYAFRKTLERFIESYEKFIEMSKTGKIYISKKVNVYDLLDDGNTQKLMYLIEQQDVMEFETKEFSSQFFRDLQADLAQLKSMQFIWSLIGNDPKLDEFKRNLTTNPLIKDKKAIVFTESTETAQYLYEELKEIYGERIIYFSGQSSAALKVEIEDSFNPKFKNKNNDKYDLLITTDVLAEGINLHRANVLVNYDLPWNPTRIMQRVGRINRVGTEFDRIYVFNFFPTAQSKKQMPLEERILEKLQAFHDTLGEDFKYLSDDEEVSSKKLFSDLTSDLDGEEESTNPELAYLAIIRQIRDNDPKLFSMIKRLPKKAKAGKASEKVSEDSTVTFIRQGALKTFFVSSEAETKQLSFMQAIDLIKAEPDDAKVSVSSKFYEHFDSNSTAFDQMLVAEEEVSTEKVMVAGNDAKIIRLLKAMKTEPRLTDDQEQTIEKLITLWENGEIPAKVSKDVMKKSKVVGDVLELYYEILKLVPPTYFEERKSQKAQVDGEKQIVLSCYLKTGGTR